MNGITVITVLPLGWFKLYTGIAYIGHRNGLSHAEVSFVDLFLCIPMVLQHGRWLGFPKIPHIAQMFFVGDSNQFSSKLNKLHLTFIIT